VPGRRRHCPAAQRRCCGVERGAGELEEGEERVGRRWLCADRTARQLRGRAAERSNGGRQRANRGAASAFLLFTPNDADEGEATVALSHGAARWLAYMCRKAVRHDAHRRVASRARDLSTRSSARLTANRRGGRPTVATWPTTEAQRRPYAGDCAAQHVAAKNAGARALALSSRRLRPFQFRDPVLEIIKLQKVSTYSKISKTKSCRGAIDLQLSQREIYVLINGKILTKLQKFSAPSYCSQRVQLDFWPICTQNLNVRQLRKMCSRK
jgi:hypothetical protein